MDIIFTTSQKQDSAIQYMTDVYNINHPRAPIGPLVFLKNTINGMLDSWISTFETNQRTTKAQLYQKATPEDQTTIDVILEKYK